MAAGNSCRQATASQDVQILLLSCKNEKKKEKEKLLPRTWRRQTGGIKKERKEGRKEKRERQDVYGENLRAFVTVIARTLCCLYAHRTHDLKRRSPHTCTVTSQIPLKPLCSTQCDRKTRSFGARTRLKKTLKNPSRILPAPLRTSRSHTASWTDRFGTLLPLI